MKYTTNTCLPVDILNNICQYANATIDVKHYKTKKNYKRGYKKLLINMCCDNCEVPRDNLKKYIYFETETLCLICKKFNCNHFKHTIKHID